MATATQQSENWNLNSLLNNLRKRQPTHVAAQYERELAALPPNMVLGEIVGAQDESPYLLSSLANVLAAWYRNAYGAPPEMFLNKLLDLSTPKYPLMVRVAAVDALGLTGVQHPFVHEYLRLLARTADEDAGLRASASDALENLAD